MKLTLLDMVQDIMSDSDSDLVNSIDDTPESQQVAQIIKTAFYDIINTKNWPHLRQLSQLDSGSTAQPTHCKLPTRVKELKEVRYDIAKATDTRKRYQSMEYLYPDEFLDRVNALDTSNANVSEVVDNSGVTLAIKNDTAPQYWTSFDDEYIVFDSYDSAVDTTIQNSKTAIIIIREPTWTHTDNAIPDLPSEAFSLLLAEAKSRAFLALSQEPNEKAEQQARRSRIWLSRKGYEAKGGVRYPNYGRRGRK